MGKLKERGREEGRKGGREGGKESWKGIIITALAAFGVLDSLFLFCLFLAFFLLDHFFICLFIFVYVFTPLNRLFISSFLLMYVYVCS